MMAKMNFDLLTAQDERKHLKNVFLGNLKEDKLKIPEGTPPF